MTMVARFSQARHDDSSHRNDCPLRLQSRPEGSHQVRLFFDQIPSVMGHRDGAIAHREPGKQREYHGCCRVDVEVGAF